MRFTLPFLALLSLAACSRSGLSVDRDSSIARPDAGVGRDAGAPRDAGPDAQLPDAGAPQCTLTMGHEPYVLLDEGARGEGLGVPRLVVIDDGASGTDARVLIVAQHLHFWHSDVRAIEVIVGDAWPEAVREGRGWRRWGIDAHSFHVVRHARGTNTVGLSYYHGDEAAGRPAGVVFIPLDLETWQPRAEVMVRLGASYASSLAIDGSAYFVSYLERGESGSETRVVRLDSTGQPTGEPITVATARGRDNRGAAVEHNGVRTIVAVNEADGVTTSRLDWGLRTVAPLGRVDAEPGRRPRAPSILAGGGSTWVAWREEVPDAPEEGHVARLLRLDPDGIPRQPPVEHRDRLLAGPALAAGRFGGVSVFGAQGDSELRPQEVGASRIVVLHSGYYGERQDVMELPTTQLRYGQSWDAAWLAGPQALLLTWTAPSTDGGGPVIWIARLDCVPR